MNDNKYYRLGDRAVLDAISQYNGYFGNGAWNELPKYEQDRIINEVKLKYFHKNMHS